MVKLAIAQMVFGVLTVGDFWLAAAAGRWPVVFILPLTIFLVLGLSVLGCGIAQFLKARRW